MPAARKPSKSVSGISDGVVILSSSVPGTPGIGVPTQPANLASPAFGRRVRRRQPKQYSPSNPPEWNVFRVNA